MKNFHRFYPGLMLLILFGLVSGSAISSPRSQCIKKAQQDYDELLVTLKHSLNSAISKCKKRGRRTPRKCIRRARKHYQKQKKRAHKNFIKRKRSCKKLPDTLTCMRDARKDRDRSLSRSRQKTKRDIRKCSKKHGKSPKHLSCLSKATARQKKRNANIRRKYKHDLKKCR